jgi:hypothetical protein
MQNVEMKVEKKNLVITVDLTKEFGRSKSGKTITIASTKGNVKVDGPNGEVSVGLNVYKKPE